MIDIKLLFNSLKAVWITKLFKCDPYIHRWAQLANVYYKPFLQCNTNLVFNIDESNCFDKLQCLSAFYKDVLLCFNKAYTVNAEEFKENIFDQLDHLYYTNYAQGKKPFDPLKIGMIEHPEGEEKFKERYESYSSQLSNWVVHFYNAFKEIINHPDRKKDFYWREDTIEDIDKATNPFRKKKDD